MTVPLKDIFLKDINRHIDGVIKADDTENLEPVDAFGASDVIALRRLYQDLFGRTPTSSDGKGLGRETGEAIEELARSVETHLSRDRDYPFVTALTPFRTALAELRGKPASWYVSQLAGKTGDDLASLKEDLYDPVHAFLNGPQREILDEARRVLLAEAANLDFVDAALVDRIRTAAEAADVYRGTKVQGIKTDLDRLKSDIRGLVAKERETATADLRALSDQLLASPEFTEAAAAAQEEVRSALTALEDRITQERLIPSIRTVLGGFRRDRYSLDAPGLILANQGDTAQTYLDRIPNPTFAPDRDNVIPLFEEDWFADDAYQRFREFLSVTFGTDRLVENLEFMRTALGKEVRTYLAKDF